MSRKRIKKKAQKVTVKELKALRQQIQKSIIEADAVGKDLELDPDKVLADFQDLP